jgi:hypothetical protein
VGRSLEFSFPLPPGDASCAIPNALRWRTDVIIEMIISEGTHPVSPMIEPAHEPTGAERRRSERVFLQVAIFVQGLSPDGRAFREKTKTLAVNAHGALIHFAQDIRAGDTVTLTHGVTEEQQACRVVYAKPSSGNIRAVGLEFLKPAPKFWQIAFPPSDWKPFEE